MAQRKVAEALRSIGAGFVALALALEEATPKADVPPLMEEGLVAERYGIEPLALVAGRKAGELTGHRVGRRVLLSLAEVEAWIATKAECRSPKPRQEMSRVERALAEGRLRRIGGAR